MGPGVLDSPAKARSQASPSSQGIADSIVAAWNPANKENRQTKQQQQQQQQPLQPRQQDNQSRNQSLPRRVCTACRRRKVGCDKKQPCHHCEKSGTDCVYPPEGSSAARQFLTDNQLWEQLHRLEPMFKTLAECMQQGTIPRSSDPFIGSSSRPDSIPTLPQTQLPEVNNDPTSPSPPTPPNSIGSSKGACRDLEKEPAAVDFHRLQAQQVAISLGPKSPARILDIAAGDASKFEIPNIECDSAQGDSVNSWSPYGTSTGKLVRDDGRERYVSGTFWEALHTENDLDDGVISEDDSEFEEQTPSSRSGLLQYSLISTSGTHETDTRSLHPPLNQRLEAWQLYNTNVHPVATVLHIPSVEPIVLEAMHNPQNLSAPLEALLFVIYVGAVNSLSDDECEARFGSAQSDLLAQFRRGADAAFVRARLMVTDDMLTIQAFVVYLIALRCRDPTYSWSMTGLAVRLAQSLGMHRDGTTFGLPPFEAEMRRRLWWSICILDTPASEDYSCSSGLLELSSFDSRPPMNLNDADLYPDMTEYPSESKRITTMSFTAARCWASDIWRTIIDTRRVDSTTGLNFISMTIADKEAWVERQRENIAGKISESQPSHGSLHCLTTSFVGTIVANLRLMVLNPLSSGVSLTDEQKRRAFQNAIECMAHSYRLRTDPQVAQWSWLTKCYNEWHAFAVVLSELCNQPLGRDADKAWRVVEQSAVLRWDSSTRHSRVHQWRSVMRSIDKARRRRKKELGRRKSSLSDRRSSSASSAAKRPTFGGRYPSKGIMRPNASTNLVQSDNSQMGAVPLPRSAERELDAAMYNADEMIGPLMEMDDMCDFTNEDGQLYFSHT
ncbi:fungal-specific transcription factor domain-containing protein [Colletotrichum godetiae]|uniref:Fungal-specific transcription factor domain-containing protein n=1 Tax=Colletotrichum godetiae TaxID=1209918 RepID=A0AAJ0F2J5_9PEZI|nr:fungal-specific transcription factor domain-containing protein [Colletotrichum godetiae]KAK1690552.1 fungal-specific transcription factor domain-containing protein [Colletotrichum godetiae]